MDPLLVPASRPLLSAVRPAPPSVSAVEASLRETAKDLFGEDAKAVRLDGKLLRPRVALRRNSGSGALRAAALSIQLAHEASLLHDDVVDGAATRRDRPTTPARDGAAAALIAGDRLLTLAYRAAAATGSPTFVHYFALAVDRTVAGEARQGTLRGRTLDIDEYRSVIEDKSGALFAIAMAAQPILDVAQASASTVEIEASWDLGLRIGALYQMVDDLLDYCPAMERGKPSMTDFRQEKWTLPLLAIGDPTPFSMTEEAAMERLVTGLHGGPPGPSWRSNGSTPAGRSTDSTPLRRALRVLEEEAEEILGRLGDQVAEEGIFESRSAFQSPSTPESPSSPEVPIGPESLGGEVLGWVRLARDGVRKQEASFSPEARVESRARGLGEPRAWPRLFGRHSRSFHFAARLFPPDMRRRITGIYVFCRFTDDLVDEADLRTGGDGRDDIDPASANPARMDPGAVDRARLRARLEAWRSLVRRAHGGDETGIPLLDRVVRPAGGRGIPLSYLDDLLNGVEMDVDPPEYPDLDALRVYTYRVASVVGGWITEEFGVRNPGILDRAFALGHAMQMTNILRDVGEDLRAGRLYLPLDRMAAHGIVRTDLEAAARGMAPMPSGYPDLLEELMEYADSEYRFARSGLHALPFRARAAVSVAARVYRGIHDEIRRRGYDSLTGRAYTTRTTKLRLAIEALLSPLPSGGRS